MAGLYGFVNQLVNRLTRSEMNAHKLAVLVSCYTLCQRDTMLNKHARRFVSRHLPVILGNECDRDAPALQLARRVLAAPFDMPQITRERNGLPVALRYLAISLPSAWPSPLPLV